MMRWAWVVCLAGLAMAEERPIDTLPWNATLAEALEEAEDRGAPLAVYMYKGGEEGDAAVAIGASEATRALCALALYRIDVSTQNPDRMEFAKRWVASCDLERLPMLALIGPDGQWKGQVSSFDDARALQETFEGVVVQLAKPPVEAGFYRNAKRSYEKGRTAFASGDGAAAMLEFEIVVAIATNCGRDFRFTAEARKAYEEMLTEGRARIEELKVAVASKDWKKVWALGRPMAVRYQLTALSTDVSDILAAVDDDPEAVRAIEAIAAEEEREKTRVYLARVALNRGRALEILRKRVPATEVPDDAVTVVFWDVVCWTDVPWDPPGAQPAVVAIGYWLGEDRAAVLAWDVEHDCAFERAGTEDGQSIEFLDLRARDQVERRALALLREQTRWEERPVVPVSIKPGDHGKLHVSWYAGSCDDWESPVRWLSGISAVDVSAGTVEDRGHVK